MDSSPKNDIEVNPNDVSSFGLDECFGALADEASEQSEINEEAQRLAELSINSLIDLLPPSHNVQIEELSSEPLNKPAEGDKRKKSVLGAQGRGKADSTLLMLHNQSEKSVRDAQMKTALSQEVQAQSTQLNTYEQEYLKLCQVLRESLEGYAKTHNFVLTEREIEAGVKHLLKYKDLTPDYIMQFILGYRAGITEGYERHTADLVKTIEYSSTLNKEQHKAVRDTEKVLNIAQQIALTLKQMFPKDGTLQVPQPASVAVKSPAPLPDPVQEEKDDLQKKKQFEKELLEQRRQEEIRERARKAIEEEAELSLNLSANIQVSKEKGESSLGSLLQKHELESTRRVQEQKILLDSICDLTNTKDAIDVDEEEKEDKEKVKDDSVWQEKLKSVTTLLGDMNMRIEDVYQRFKEHPKRELEKETMLALNRITNANWAEMKKFPKTKAKYRKILNDYLTSRLT